MIGDRPHQARRAPWARAAGISSDGVEHAVKGLFGHVSSPSIPAAPRGKIDILLRRLLRLLREGVQHQHPVHERRQIDHAKRRMPRAPGFPAHPARRSSSVSSRKGRARPGPRSTDIPPRRAHRQEIHQPVRLSPRRLFASVSVSIPVQQLRPDHEPLPRFPQGRSTRPRRAARVSAPSRSAGCLSRTERRNRGRSAAAGPRGRRDAAERDRGHRRDVGVDRLQPGDADRSTCTTGPKPAADPGGGRRVPTVAPRATVSIAPRCAALADAAHVGINWPCGGGR